MARRKSGDDADVRRIGRRKTGRNVPFNQTVSPETANIFYDLARELEITMGEVLERAAEALQLSEGLPVNTVEDIKAAKVETPISSAAKEIWERETREICELARQFHEEMSAILEGLSASPDAESVATNAAKRMRSEWVSLGAELLVRRKAAKAKLRRLIVKLYPDETRKTRKQLHDEVLQCFMTPLDHVQMGQSLCELEHQATLAAEKAIAGKKATR